MKKILLSFALTLSLFSALAQGKQRTFKPFRLDLAFGYAAALGSGMHSGVIFAAEPRYAFSDKLTAGLRLELANTGPEDPVMSFISDLNFTTSMALTTDYYFSTKHVRPFVGVGVGVFTTPAKDDPNTELVETQDDFGFFPRVGLEAGRFRAALEVNVNGNTPTGNFSYLGFKAGFFLWGRRVSKG